MTIELILSLLAIGLSVGATWACIVLSRECKAIATTNLQLSAQIMGLQRKIGRMSGVPDRLQDTIREYGGTE